MTFPETLTRDEIAQLQAMTDRLRTARPSGRGPALDMHHATEDALRCLVALGHGNPSCAAEFADIGRTVRKAVLNA